MNQIAVYGAGGCGRGVIPLARRQLERDDQSFELVFVDDNSRAAHCNGHEVHSYDRWMERPATKRSISLAIANGRIRETLARRCEKDGIRFFQVRAESVLQYEEVSLGEGAILCPFVTLTSNIKIGRHFHANLYSYVEHDCLIGDFVTFAPGVRCNGNVLIEDYVYVGAGAIIKQGTVGDPLIIGRGAVVGMGAVVTRDVPPGVTVVGNPAQPLKSV